MIDVAAIGTENVLGVDGYVITHLLHQGPELLVRLNVSVSAVQAGEVFAFEDRPHALYNIKRG